MNATSVRLHQRLRAEGDALLAARQPRAALQRYGRLLAAGDDHDATAEARWICHMLLGEFEEAWAISDMSLARRVAEGPCWHWPRHRQWVWDGRPLAGKRVLVRCYHGLGDTLQFSRFLPALRATAREVILWAQPELLPLLQGFPGVDRLLPLHDGTPDAEFDADIEIMEIPHALRTTLDTLPASIPFPAAPPPRQRPPRMSGDSFRIGLVWAAGAWNAARGVPIELLAPLADLPDVSLVALQRGPSLADVARPGAPRFGSIGDGSCDILATASTIRDLDLVVTVDTMVAHLAGALGAPVWTLLQYEPEWRWMVDRDDSLWYPTMRLYRQPAPGDWQNVVNRLHADLNCLIAFRSKAPAISKAIP